MYGGVRLQCEDVKLHECEGVWGPVQCVEVSGYRLQATRYRLQATVWRFTYFSIYICHSWRFRATTRFGTWYTESDLSPGVGPVDVHAEVGCLLTNEWPHLFG